MESRVSSAGTAKQQEAQMVAGGPYVERLSPSLHRVYDDGPSAPRCSISTHPQKVVQ